MKVLCVIPARYASTRLPGKPLALIAGKPMIQHVYMKACEAKLPDDVIVATDNEKVFETVHGFGGRAIMTSPDHPSGTDRLAEVALNFPDVDVIVNVQGDEPMIPPEIIDRCQIFRSIYSNTLKITFQYFYLISVFQNSQLLQTFCFFQFSGCQSSVLQKEITSISINTNMLIDLIVFSFITGIWH